MTKHLADHREPSKGGRSKHFLNLEKMYDTDRRHPAILKLARRPVDRSDATRTREFVRIERGLTA